MKTRKLGKELESLQAFLLEHCDMMLSQLDGLLAGIAVCPDMIMPSEWMPLVLGEDGPVFENEQQAQAITGGIMSHYNDILRRLDNGSYTPIYNEPVRADALIWGGWIGGFMRSYVLRVKSWEAVLDEWGDPDTETAVVTFLQLYSLAYGLSEADEDPDLSKALMETAPDIIPVQLEKLHHARNYRDSYNPFTEETASSANDNVKIGRNDPCPCGSGRKFKKCCLN